MLGSRLLLLLGGLGGRHLHFGDLGRVVFRLRHRHHIASLDLRQFRNGCAGRRQRDVRAGRVLEGDGLGGRAGLAGFIFCLHGLLGLFCLSVSRCFLLGGGVFWWGGGVWLWGLFWLGFPVFAAGALAAVCALA